MSRLEEKRRDGIEPEMPPASAPHIVGYLMEAGPAELSAMGMAPISWSTIGEWGRLTGVRLPGWQSKLLRRLSAEWVTESSRATKPDAPAPWLQPGTVDARAAIDAKLRAFFTGLGKGGD